MGTSPKSKPSQTSTTSAYVALLRGVNVGGKNKLSMLTLAEMFIGAGGADVRTYIQSGNVVFRASTRLARLIPDVVSRQIAQRLGLNVPIVLRSSDELVRIARSNPFLKPGVDETALQVLFLADDPAPHRVKSLDPDRSPGETYELRGRNIYLRCVKGATRGRLTNAYFDSALATVSTARNWRTVMKLTELARSIR